MREHRMARGWRNVGTYIGQIKHPDESQKPNWYDKDFRSSRHIFSLNPSLLLVLLVFLSVFAIFAVRLFFGRLSPQDIPKDCRHNKSRKAMAQIQRQGEQPWSLHSLHCQGDLSFESKRKLTPAITY